MQLRNFIYIVILLAIVATIGLVFIYTFRGGPAEHHHRITEKAYSVEPVKMPEELFFAGEKVPLDKYFVVERLERELTVNTYWHSSTILLMKRAARWFPIITPILLDHGIPEDFKYLALIESNFTLDVSPSGASGYWQILKGTASDLGLEISRDVDERYHVKKATAAAARYMLDAYHDLGSWALVAAAYNAGKRRVKESMEEQKTDNYYDLFLNEETSRYVFRILAMKQIFENPRDYDFFLSEYDLYEPYRYREVLVEDDISDLPRFAREQGTTYRSLKEFNPWLRNNKLKIPRGKKYLIAIPEGGF